MRGVAGELEGSASLLSKLASRWGEDVPEAKNPAKKLARQITGRLPVVYGGGLLSGVARRWKNDFNENSKSWAAAETFPELCHNAVTAYEVPQTLRREVCVILLRSSLLSAKLRRTYQLTAEFLRRAGVCHAFVDAEGSGPLEHILSSVYLGIWVSYYVALLYGVDPSPVPGIDLMKQRVRHPPGLG